MKKVIIKKSQNGSSFDKKVTKSIKLTPRENRETKSDSARAVDMANYRYLRAMNVRGSTPQREKAYIPTPPSEKSKADYKKVRASQKNGGTIKRKK